MSRNKTSPKQIKEAIATVDKVIEFFDPERPKDREGLKSWQRTRRALTRVLKERTESQSRIDHKVV